MESSEVVPKKDEKESEVEELIISEKSKQEISDTLDRILDNIRINDPDRYERAMKLANQGNGNNGHGKREGQGTGPEN